MRITVKVKTGARENNVRRIDEAHYSVTVKERPIEGKANTAVIRALSFFFHCPQSCVILKSGESSKLKVFDILL